MRNLILDCIESKLTEKINSLEIDLAGVKTAIWEETKSSAGDKYETGRAMAQNTQKMYLEQLTRLKADLNQFNQIKNTDPKKFITEGSLIKTDLGIIFLGVSVGSFNLENQKVITATKESPLGQNLMGKSQNDTFELNQKKYVIEII